MLKAKFIEKILKVFWLPMVCRGNWRNFWILCDFVKKFVIAIGCITLDYLLFIFFKFSILRRCIFETEKRRFGHPCFVFLFSTPGFCSGLFIKISSYSVRFRSTNSNQQRTTEMHPKYQSRPEVFGGSDSDPNSDPDFCCPELFGSISSLTWSVWAGILTVQFNNFASFFHKLLAGSFLKKKSMPKKHSVFKIIEAKSLKRNIFKN